MFKDLILRSLQKATGEKNIDIQTPEVEEYGDYATNVALKLKTKNLKLKTARGVAEDILVKLRKDEALEQTIEKIEVAGPGFINFWLNKEELIGELEKVIKEADKYGSSNLGKGKTVVIDYSSPNIAKRFGIGHMRSTIIGQALYNLYSFLGYKAVGDNHLGDWGTQFGAILAQISNIKYQISKLTIDKLEELYVDFNQKAEKNPELLNEARAWFKKLEDGSAEARKIWKEVVDISSREFERIYKLFGVHIDQALGESFYVDKMPEVIKVLKDKGLAKNSEGAEIVEFGPTASGLPPAMLIKSDGTTTYYTRDLATLKFRIDKWNPDLIIYEVGSEQTLYFRQLFETAKLLSWAKGRELVHVGHGLIRFKSGKMSTRRGQTIKLEDVLNEAIGRANKIIEASETPFRRAAGKAFGDARQGSAGQASRGFSSAEKEKVAQKVGIGAVKYFDLMHHPASDIIFDWGKMFVLEGNSAPYLQYTFARTQSVLRKAQSSKLKAKNNLPSGLSLKLNAEELSVMRSLVHFPEVIEDAATNYSPNLLCNYLFDLAQKYNNFYNMHRILEPKVKGQEGKKVKELRLALTAATGQILKNGLTMLGISSPEKM